MVAIPAGGLSGLRWRNRLFDRCRSTHSRAPVTNAEFQQFVDATGYQTVSERPDPTLYPDLPPEEQILNLLFLFRLRRWIAANLCPGGPSLLELTGEPDTSLGQHPVVHVAFEDALRRLGWKTTSSADEWEIAARGASGRLGSEKTPEGRWLANVWQGPFPWVNQETDGWFWTSPVGSFPANGYGLVDVCGNVWEWTSTPYAVPDGEQERRVIKGGSFLCADNYCHRFRPSALMGQTLDTATCHMAAAQSTVDKRIDQRRPLR